MTLAPHRQADDAPPDAKPVKVLVVDDSASMRAWLSYVIDQDPRLTVVAQAADAHEARALIKQFRPDVLTLDLALPQMNGLEFLAHLMRLRPMPVIVFSGLVASQGNVAAAAMKLGAFACIPKPSSPDASALTSLREQLIAAGTQPGPAAKQSAPVADNIVLIGASTGGVAAIEAVLMAMPETSPPIVIAQHMPQRFLESFADRLNRLLSHDVQLAQPGTVLRDGTVHVAPALDKQTCVRWDQSGWIIEMRDRWEEDTFCPSVDRLFSSAVPWADYVGAMILTGIGDDGARGMLALSQAGARTIGQTQDSSVVYGMPGAAHALGAVEQQADPAEAGRLLLRMMDQSE